MLQKTINQTGCSMNFRCRSQYLRKISEELDTILYNIPKKDYYGYDDRSGHEAKIKELGFDTYFAQKMVGDEIKSRKELEETFNDR